MRPNLIYTALLPVNGKWCPLNRMTTRSGKVFTITILARNLKENVTIHVAKGSGILFRKAEISAWKTLRPCLRRVER